jgi:transcriptional regulator, propionate catabolism operon regulatory protein
LNRYHWPGNVRELQNVIERIAVELADTQGAVFTRDMLDVVAPELFVVNKTQGMNALTLRERSRHVEADEVRAMLDACNGDRDATCKALGISKTTLWRKLNALP